MMTPPIVKDGKDGVLGAQFVGNQCVLFVMRPHPKNLNGLDVFEDLIDETMLDVDAPGVCSGQVADELFVGRRRAVRVLFKNREEDLRLRLQTGGGKVLCIFLGLLRVDELPTHQSRSSSHSSTGVLMPSRMDSLIPGTETR